MIYLNFPSFGPETFHCGSFTTHVALKTDAQKDNMHLMKF